MTGRNLLDNVMIEQQRSVHGALHVQFEEGLRAERRIGRDGHPLTLRELDEGALREVRVMFDLEGRGDDFGVAEEIHDQGAVEIADADAAGQAGWDERFHCRPGFLDGGAAPNHVFSVVREARRVAFGRVDVLQGNRKMHDVEVEVVDPPVLKLLFANRFNTFRVMERVPQLGYEEELLALDDAFLEGSRNALATFDFVSVILIPMAYLAIVGRKPPHFPPLTTCAIKQAVSKLDGIVDLIGTCFVIHLP